MAVAQFKAGDPAGQLGGTWEVFGDSSSQTITILDNSSITFRSGFNSGAIDNITVNGLAQNFVISQSLGNVTLTSAVDGITLLIPVGTNGMNITFDNGDTRLLDLNGAVVTLGAQVVGGAPAAVTPGPGVYSVSGNPQQLEGTAYIFTVTRTDTSIAGEQLTFNVQGSTKGGTVTAAIPGADFTAAGNTVTFAGNSATATFTVNLNLDSDVEGLEGILAQVFKAGNVVGSTVGLIEDANKVGQTFFLTTSPADTIGSGLQTDIVGSEGSTSVIGQDTIIVTENTANIFDSINGGPEVDLLRILDASTGGTTAPNFTFITVQNVENATYLSTRGLFNGFLDTSAWTGLKTFMGVLDSGVDQTFRFASTGLTSITLANTDDGDVNVEGGSGVLTVNATDPGDINVGQTGPNTNAFTSIFTNGGDDLTITDTSGAQTLTSAQLSGFDDDATITAGNLATLNITNLTGANVRQVTVNGAGNPTVNLSNIALTGGGALSVTAQNSAQFVVGNGVTTGIADFTALSTSASSLTLTGNNQLNFDDFNTDDGSFLGPIVTATITNNSSNGNAIVFDDVNGDTAGGNDLRTLNLNATSGAIFFDDIFASTGAGVAINIAGSNFVQYDALTHVGGAVITRTGSGGTNITSQLSNVTQFVGSADTGADSLIFGASQTANTLGGGNDYVVFNSGVMGNNGLVFGSIDAGAQTDTFQIDQDDAVTLTAQGNFLSNFELAFLTGGGAAGQTQIVNTANLGFSANPTNIISQGASTTSTKEVTTITFSGTASGMTQGSAATVNTADTLLFDGVTTTFDDNANALAMAADFTATYNAAVATNNWSAVDNLNGTVTLTKDVGGSATDLTTANFVFTDKANIGAPSGTVGNIVNGTSTAGAVEVATLNFGNVAVANGETITVTDGTNSFTYTNTTGGTLLGSDGVGPNPAVNNSLASAFVAAFNSATTNPGALWLPVSNTSYTASVSNGNVVFTADTASAKPDLSINGPASTGLTAPADIYSLTVGTQGVDQVALTPETFDFTVTGAGNANDTITFDGVLITLNGTEDTNEEVAARFAGFVSANWTVTLIVGNVVTFTSNTLGNKTNVATAAFVVVDDTNTGTGSVAVAAPSTSGDVGGLILNNVTANGSLELQGNGLYTVNLASAVGAADVFNLLLTGSVTNTVTVPGVETVNVNTDGNAGGTDTLTLVDTALATLNVTGSDSLALTHAGTAISTLNAGGLGATAAITWTSGALANAISVTTGGGGSTINLLAATKAVTFTGGSGNDTLVLNNANNTTVNLNGGNDTVTTGTGLTNSIFVGANHDTVNITQTLNGNSYSKVCDYTAASISAVGGSGDLLHFQDGNGTFNAVMVPTLQPTASFQDYLDAAAAGPAGTIRWFQFTSGVGANNNTYVVDDNSALATFQNGIDNVIELTGLINLGTSGSAGNTGNVFIA